MSPDCEYVQGGSAVVGIRVRVGAPVTQAHVVITRERIATIASLGVVTLKLFQTVGLHERYLVAVLLVVVVGLRLVDVPQTEATAWEISITTIQLPILEEEVLCIGHPTLVHFTPSTRLGGVVPITVVRAGCHEAPAANASRAAVHVVQIWPPEEEMADLVSTHAELAVSGNSQSTRTTATLLTPLGFGREALAADNVVPGLKVLCGRRRPSLKPGGRFSMGRRKVLRIAMSPFFVMRSLISLKLSRIFFRTFGCGATRQRSSIECGIAGSMLSTYQCNNP